MSEILQEYTRSHPYKASIKQRYFLGQPGSKKETKHVIIDLGDSGITYEVGDCLGVYPDNDPGLVQKSLDAMQASGNEWIADPQEGQLHLRDFLTRKANLSSFSRKLLSLIAEKQSNSVKKTQLEELLSEGHKEALKNYLYRHELWEVLAEHAEVRMGPQEVCSLLMPLLPRLYSIASAQEVVGNEAHLTVANLSYQTNHHLRRGVCTHYLCDLAPVGEKCLLIYPHPHRGFTLPQDPQASLIMIGPGTGIAPYRGFLQRRFHQGDTGRNWIFFGEWNRATDYFYEEEWQEMQSKIPLKVDTAFSRDQDYKIYVQHRMLEQGAELFSWLEEGAYIFVCGDANHMAKDVDGALHQIVEKHGGKTPEEAKAYLKELKHAKRYLRDVY